MSINPDPSGLPCPWQDPVGTHMQVWPVGVTIFGVMTVVAVVAGAVGAAVGDAGNVGKVGKVDAAWRSYDIARAMKFCFTEEVENIYFLNPVKRHLCPLA